MNYARPRKAFGRAIRKFPGGRLHDRQAQVLLDASRAMIYQAARAAECGAPNVRRIVSETKKFVTKLRGRRTTLPCRSPAGSGYTDRVPDRARVRDTRLAQIWTGTNEIMSAMIQHDSTMSSVRARPLPDFERDAMHADETEKIFDDDDMWKVYERDA